MADPPQYPEDSEFFDADNSRPKSQNRFVLLAVLVGVAIIGSGFGLLWWLAGGGSLGSLTTIANRSVDEAELDTTPTGILRFEDDIPVPDGLFSYGGSTTWVPVHPIVEPAIAAQFPDYQLRYTLPVDGITGSGVGIEMLLNGQLAFSESSRSVKPEEYDAAQQRGFELEQIPIAIDGIALAVHPDLTVAGLNVTQIQAIYTGAVTNWSELGGPNLPIQALSRSAEASGTAEFFLESVVGADAFGDSVRITDSTTESLRFVSETPGAIYYASAPEVITQCAIYPLPVAPTNTQDYVAPYEEPLTTNCPTQRNSLNRADFRSGDYPLTRRLFVIVKVDGSSDEAAGRAYTELLLSPGGQAMVEQAGFVGVR